MQETLDRLSSLTSRFSLQVAVDAFANANLAIYTTLEGDLSVQKVVFTPGRKLADRLTAETVQTVLFSARVEWGGPSNPLIDALPACIDIVLDAESDLLSVSELLAEEGRQSRCGSTSVINRLGEVLIIRLLRHQLAGGNQDIGMLGGLADAKVSKALVAMHDEPGKSWDIDQLANTAGLSVSRFCDRFARCVGQSPMSYLRQWRMLLARQDVEKGDRIQSIAHRYGYGSSEAMNRAFKKHFGVNPLQYRSRGSDFGVGPR